MATAPAAGRRVLGWDADWDAVFASLPGAPMRVARVDRGWLRVLSGSGELSVAQPVDGPAMVTGDWIAVRSTDDGPAVTALAPRRTALVRRDPAGSGPRPQTLASNIDQVWIVHAVDQPLRAGWLDRALVLAFGSGADVLVVVAKADLAGADGAVEQVRALAPGVPVTSTSSTEGRGVADLRSRLAGGGSAAMLGRSGSGKSSLLNALVGTAVQRTRTVRTGDAMGRHTTTRRALVCVAGGTVIDTPGLRALGLWDPATGLALTFPAITALAEHCRFGDCSHRHEPGCAVLAARDGGDLDVDRYNRYITLSN